MKQIEVVTAIIRKGDKIFATQRGYGDFKDWWEFPGGNFVVRMNNKLRMSISINEALAIVVKFHRKTALRKDNQL